MSSLILVDHVLGVAPGPLQDFARRVGPDASTKAKDCWVWKQCWIACDPRPVKYSKISIYPNQKIPGNLLLLLSLIWSWQTNPGKHRFPASEDGTARRRSSDDVAWLLLSVALSSSQAWVCIPEANRAETLWDVHAWDSYPEISVVSWHIQTCCNLQRGVSLISLSPSHLWRNPGGMEWPSRVSQKSRHTCELRLRRYGKKWKRNESHQESHHHVETVTGIWKITSQITCSRWLGITLSRYVFKAWVWLNIFLNSTLSRDLPEYRHHLRADPQLLRVIGF